MAGGTGEGRGDKMARPRKNTVDYFPHSCDHGKTMFILEERYGNNGYAFWFKLLETLGSTEQHFINLNNETEFEYLRSKTRCEEGLVTEMLNLLSRLGAIDSELWQNKIIWSQNFVDGISDVYTRSRHTLPPAKPDNYAVKPHVTDITTQINPQSKVKKRKVKKRKESNEFLLPDDIDKNVWDAFVEHRNNLKKPLTLYAKSLILKKLNDLGQNKNAVLNQSIVKGWQDVFELKNNGNGQGMNRTSHADDMIDRALRGEI